MFHQCLYFQITKNDPANENKAIKGCSHKHNKVPQLSPSLQTPSNAIIEQATNNVPYTAESIEDNNICLQKRMELLKRMWLQEWTGPRLENILLSLFAFIIRVDYVKSLSTVILNSRDRHEKTWRPTFSRLHNTPYNMLYLKKTTEIHW